MVPQIPLPLRIIAWLAMAVGVLLMCSAAMALIFLVLLRPMSGGSFNPLALVDWFLRDMLGWLLAQAAVGVGAFVCGVAVLRRKRWGRAGLEAVCWLLIVCLVGPVVVPLIKVISASGIGEFGARVDWAAFATGLMAWVAMLIPVVLALRYLRGPEARANAWLA